MSSTPLFRQAALDNRQGKWFGEIILMRPLSFTFLTMAAVACAGVLVLFICFASYTKRSTVLGQLKPDTGVIKVIAPQIGIVSQKNVVEGQAVKQGQVLFTISSERQSSTEGDTHSKISRQVASRQQSLKDEILKTQRLQRDEIETLHRRVSALQTELLKVKSQIDGQKVRVKLAEDAMQRAQELLTQQFISKEQLQQKQADLLDQNARLQALERDALTTARELSNQEAELASAPLRQQNQMAQIERLLASTGQEFTESEARRSVAITAPEAGIATALGIENGQAVDGSKPLLSIVPQRARMQAELYAPTRAIGFIKPNDPVLLRYQAFPYQKFGHARGKVISVSRTALGANEISGIPVNQSGESLYRIIVELDSQTINAYGKAQALQASMLLDADVLQEKRRVYEWVLEPLYSLTGKL